MQKTGQKGCASAALGVPGVCACADKMSVAVLWAGWGRATVRSSTGRVGAGIRGRAVNVVGDCTRGRMGSSDSHVTAHVEGTTVGVCGDLLIALPHVKRMQ
ncbi:hypothetical protein DENSPDRAFT_836949 [Dentipellis sp. KUC8613]|nr:hypothetical protein DENSPDRAFT_836949 [Dentipellis sp. KUC8613]